MRDRDFMSQASGSAGSWDLGLCFTSVGASESLKNLGFGALGYTTTVDAKTGQLS